MTTTIQNASSISVQQVARVFTFNGVNLPDPGPDFTPEEIKDIYSAQYPDLITALISPPTVNSDGTAATYEFVRSVGTKG